jgi:hypothetical protein
MPRSLGRRGTTGGLMLLFLLNGCATMTRPETPAPTHTFKEGSSRAQEVLFRYQDAADSGRGWTNALYVWLSAIGSTIIGLAVTGTTGSPITGLGLGGAFSYGVSTWFIKPQNLSIYKAGTDALLCVLQESTPLTVADPQNEALKKAIAPDADFPKALAQLAEALATLEGVPTNGDAEAARKRETSIAGHTALDAATTLLKNARVTQSQLEQAGQQLWNAVSVIENEVIFALARSTDPRDVMAHFQQNVVGTYKNLIGLSGGTASTLKATDAITKPQAAAVSSNTALDAAIKAVADAVTNVARTSKPVADLLDAISITGVKEAIAACLGGARALNVQLIPDSVDLNPGDKKTVRVVGATAPSIEHQSGSDKAVSFKITPSMTDSIVEVTALADAKAGDYTLRVTAPAPAPPLTLHVKVNAKEAKPGTAGGESDSGKKAGAADVKDLLTLQGWTCQNGKLAVGPSADVQGATQAVLDCGNDGAAQQVVAAHRNDKALPKDVKVTTDGKGKVQLVIPGDYDAAVQLLKKGTPK